MRTIEIIYLKNPTIKLGRIPQLLKQTITTDVEGTTNLDLPLFPGYEIISICEIMPDKIIKKANNAKVIN